MTTVRLLKFNHLDNSYTNVVDFTSKQTRDTFFNNKVEHTYNINLRDDSVIDNITIPTNHKNIDYCNYCIVTDENNNNLYFFITNFTHKTPATTTIFLEIDVFTTYQFDFLLKESFVERCHVPRWNGNTPIKNTIDEALPLNEYILDSKENIIKYNQALIIASSTPLGYCPSYNKPSGGGGSTGDPEAPTDGNISKNGFRYLKGIEGFMPYSMYANNEPFRTVGYGSTERSNWNYFHQHEPYPCSEEKASQIMATRINADFGKAVADRLKADNIFDQITSNKFDAMVSVTYNAGYVFFTSESSPYQLIKNNVNDPGIRAKWEVWYIKGENENGELVELEGLKRRRKEEANIYIDNIYKMTDILVYKRGVGDAAIPDYNLSGDGFIPPYLQSIDSLVIKYKRGDNIGK